MISFNLITTRGLYKWDFSLQHNVKNKHIDEPTVESWFLYKWTPTEPLCVAANVARHTDTYFLNNPSSCIDHQNIFQCFLVCSTIRTESFMLFSIVLELNCTTSNRAHSSYSICNGLKKNVEYINLAYDRSSEFNKS